MNKPAAGVPAGQRTCAGCDKPVTRDEEALSRKLINRGTQRFYCISCLAGHYEVSEEILQDKIREFREMGCSLFKP